MKVRFDVSFVDLATDDPETVDLSRLPDWLEPTFRETLRRMDRANKSSGNVVNFTNYITVTLPNVRDGDEWKVDIGQGEIMDDED